MEKRTRCIKQVNLLCISLTALILIACSTNSYYNKSINIPEAKWHKDSVLSFAIAIEDTSAIFDFFLNVRHNIHYPYANLYLFIHSEVPNGGQTQDTLELQLANSSGKWLGKGSGGLKYNHFILTQQLRFSDTGVYRFDISQGMRCDELKGIEDMGMQLIPTTTD